MGLTLLLTISVALQFVAAFLSLKFIRITRKRTGWVLITAAISLMALHRCFALLDRLWGGPAPDPTSEWVALTISILMVAGLSAIGSFFVSIKHSEESLRCSHEKYETLMNSVDVIVWEADAQTFQFCFVSKQAERLLGYPITRWVSEPTFWKNHLYHDDRQGVLDSLADVISKKRSCNLEYRMQTADGRLIWLRNIIMAAVENSRVVRLQGIMVNITELKQAEEALQRYQLSMEHAPEGVFFMTRDAGFSYVNQQACRSLGYTRDELLSLKLWDIDPVYPKESWDAFWRQSQEDPVRTVHIDTFHRRKDGAVFPVEVSAKHLSLGGQEFHIAFVRDATDRKRAEEALQQNEVRLRVALSTIDAAVFTQDLALRYTWMYQPQLGYTTEQVVGKTDSELLPPDAACQAIRIKRQTLESGTAARGLVMVTLGDRLNYYDLFVEPLRDTDGRIVGIIGTSLNITEQKRTEEALKEAEARLRLALQAGRIGTWDWSITTGRVVWNAGHEELWGMAPGSFKGTYDEFDARLHPEDRESFNCALAKTLAERRTHYQEFRIIWPDGSVHWIASQGEPFYDEAGQLVRMIGVVMDITEPKRAEEVLRQSREQLRRLAARMDSLREKERTRIAREVHDQLGQVLTSIKIDLSLMKKALARSEHTAEELRSLLHEKIEWMLDSADAAIRTVQKIGTELRPAVLDDLGLLAAIEWQTKNFESRTGIRCRIKTDLQAVDIDPRCATAVFRIFQETLTNVARHAKATRMNIQIKEKSGQLLLNVEDNGRGISHLEIHNPASLGLLGMRERALLFNGEIHFSGISGKGTTVSLRMPLSKRKIHRKGDLSGPPK